MQTDPNWSNFFYDSSDGKVFCGCMIIIYVLHCDIKDPW